jgi:hypothetical protein
MLPSLLAWRFFCSGGGVTPDLLIDFTRKGQAHGLPL